MDASVTSGFLHKGPIIQSLYYVFAVRLVEHWDEISIDLSTHMTPNN